MSYFHYPQAGRPNSTWQASVDITPSYLLSVDISGSTGELIHIKSTGGPNIDNEFDIDAPSTTKLIKERLDTGAKQFTLDDSYAKVQNLITKKGSIAEPIKSITYQTISADRVVLSQDLTQLRAYIVLGNGK